MYNLCTWFLLCKYKSLFQDYTSKWNCWVIGTYRSVLGPNVKLLPRWLPHISPQQHCMRIYVNPLPNTWHVGMWVFCTLSEYKMESHHGFNFHFPGNELLFIYLFILLSIYLLLILLIHLFLYRFFIPVSCSYIRWKYLPH